ncbi:MAG: reverse transcriptase family protein, partial [bacterium]
PRHVPFKYREIAQKAIDDLLEQGIIRPSRSPHSTNLVVVKKKTMNGVVSHIICVDLRQVNQHTIPNSFPYYWIEEAMEKINGAYFRTALDFKNAFHQIMLTDEAIPVTAFYFNNALYEYVRAPFGHVCA